MLKSLNDFLRLESAGGILLVAAAIAAMLLDNSPLSGIYEKFLHLPVEIRFGPLYIAKPLLLWINDGLMAVFFLLVGLELKRELMEGELSQPSQIVLPAVGAVGGMLVPALIYSIFNWGDEIAMKGWAIPAATDIAFALGILTLLGKRVPTSLKIFLVSLAIFDDIGAIVIIALFYSKGLSAEALIVASGAITVLFIMNRRGVSEFAPYAFIGIVLWIAVLKSGVHATLAGVVLAMFIPMKHREKPDYSPLRSLEHDLHAGVAFVILPLFALANAGINLTGVNMDYVLHPVPVGIALALFFGKQLGVFGFCWLTIKLGFARLPEGSGWSGLYGMSLLCGVGFTMSLFIGALAFEDLGDPGFDERLGIVIGSLISGTFGYFVLRKAFPRTGQAKDAVQPHSGAD
ncbi:MAG: Na+/H+ antiporter NhaA [Gammaproteobacteria bacterium]|nr:Na+/H+ antiporter NhaA [Gammaproteobacteria bacterium]